MAYDEATKMVTCTAEVVDANEAEKCWEGVYTTFSVGCRYLKKWKEGLYTPWTGAPYEGSLVDFRLAGCWVTSRRRIFLRDSAGSWLGFVSLTAPGHRARRASSKAMRRARLGRTDSYPVGPRTHCVRCSCAYVSMRL